MATKTKLAFIIAISADGFQLLITPLLAGGPIGLLLDGACDVITACVLVALMGFHWAFLPSFLMEVIPGVSLVPLWTLAVIFVRRSQNATAQQREKQAEVVPAMDQHAPVTQIDEDTRPLH